MTASAPRPTPAELEILRVLWQRGPRTVREVHETLAQDGATTGYTTVLKLLQIMADKGLVDRDLSQRAHVYTARLPEAQTQRQLVRDLLDRAFDGSAMNLVMQALATERASAADIARIRHMLDEIERGGK